MYFLDLPESSGQDLVNALLQTYPFYHDRTSRQAVRQCLQALLTNPLYTDFACSFIDAYRAETSKAAIAPSSAFVLVEWGSLILQHCAVHPPSWDAYGLDIIVHHAKILDTCISSNTRDTVKNAALVVTRRALRKMFRETKTGDSAIQTIVSKLTAKSQSLGTKGAVLLGVVAGVCARLPTRKLALEAVKDLYYSFYVREILGSRTTVPQHIVTAFNNFFTHFASLEDLRKDVVPALEKALLRAPEVVLNDLLSPMIKALPPEIDLSDPLADHLLKPLLTNVKSQSPSIREGAMSAFTACIARANEDKPLEKIVDDVLSPMVSSKLPTIEQRVLHARMLSLVPYHSARCPSICSGLATTTIKEPNETALAAEVSALASQLSLVLASNDESSSKHLPSPVLDAFSKGLGDKRPAARRTWAMKTGETIWTLKDRSVHSVAASHFVETTIPKLFDVFDEVVTNLQPSVQTGVAGAAYVVVAIYVHLADIVRSDHAKTLIRKSKIFDRAFPSGQKVSLLNHRIYAKLSSREEVSWIVRALQAYAGETMKMEALPASGDQWAQAFLYLISAADVAPTEQKKAAAALYKVYIKQPEPISELIIRALWNWYTNVEQDEKDTPAVISKTGTSKLYLALRSVFPSSKDRKSEIDRGILCNQLIKALVLARPEILPRVEWIELCLRVGQDPGEVARSRGAECLGQVKSRLLPETFQNHKSNLAAYATAAELAFVAPEVITPILVQEVISNFATDVALRYGPTEVAIARTPEGTAFIDVLSTKSPKILDKNARDYDTIKWEEELRAQLAQKKSQERKLTADEKVKVHAQLAKEAKIRTDILQIEQNLHKGIGFILALATGPPTAAEVWMRPCLKALLDAITAGAGLLVGNAANEAYISCANLVSSRLGSLRPFIGVATLRGLETSHLPENMCQEPLGGTDLFSPLLEMFVLRIYFRSRDQTALPTSFFQRATAIRHCYADLHVTPSFRGNQRQWGWSFDVR